MLPLSVNLSRPARLLLISCSSLTSTPAAGCLQCTADTCRLFNNGQHAEKHCQQSTGSFQQQWYSAPSNATPQDLQRSLQACSALRCCQAGSTVIVGGYIAPTSRIGALGRITAQCTAQCSSCSSRGSCKGSNVLRQVAVRHPSRHHTVH
jgi:hypothetical protein